MAKKKVWKKKSLLSLHPCLADLEDPVLLWIPDSKRGKPGRELNMWIRDVWDHVPCKNLSRTHRKS